MSMNEKGRVPVIPIQQFLQKTVLLACSIENSYSEHNMFINCMSWYLYFQGHKVISFLFFNLV